MAKSIFDQLTGYRVKIDRDGKEIANLPGILALPGVIAAPKASIIGMIAMPLLGCNIHLENEDGGNVDVGKAVKDAADTVANAADAAAKAIRKEIEKTWDDMNADGPEESAEEKEGEDVSDDQCSAEDGVPEESAEEREGVDVSDGQSSAEDDVPTIRVNPDDSENS